MNIDKIEVSENDISFVLYPKEETILIGEKKYKIDSQLIEKLIRIISVWDNEYYDSSYMDGNIFEVVVYSNNKKTIKRGIRGIPKNYEAFSSLVRGMYYGR